MNENLTEKLLASFEELDFLHSLAAILARPSEVADLDGYLVRETASIFRADGGWLARRAEGSDLRSAAVHGFPAAVAEFLNERFLAPLIREEGLPFLVLDLPHPLFANNIHFVGVTRWRALMEVNDGAPCEDQHKDAERND